MRTCLFARRVAVLGLAGGALAAATSGAGPDATTQSAIYLLQESTEVARNGRHHTMLLALRHLRDPELAPLFSRLAESAEPSLKMHGILGLADCDPAHALDLDRLARCEPISLQAAIISHAMKDQALSDAQALEIVNRDDMDPGVKIVVATQLLGQGKLENRDLLRESLEASNEARRALAGLMLHQVADPEGTRELEKLNDSESPSRDQIRLLVLTTATRFGYDRIGPWATRLATEPGVSSRLGSLALRTAMRFGHAEACDIWSQQFLSATDPAQRIRLALLALRVAPYLEADLFNPAIASDDPLIKQIGRVGAAIAARARIAEHVLGLIQQNHPIANNWALGYAKEHASETDAHQILMGLVLAYDATNRNAAQCLDDAVNATQELFQRDPDRAAILLRPMLADARKRPALAQGIVLGLIRCGSPNPQSVIEGFDTLHSLRGDSLATVLRAKSDAPLDKHQMEDLAVVVRGGGGLNHALRIQAAWAYLKRTGQTQVALQDVLGQ